MNNDFNAIWQFDKEENTNIDSGNSISDVYSFIYENDSIIINLPSISSAVGLPEDDVYRIKVRWKGNELYIFPPLGDKWELFAAWENNRFVMRGDGKVKMFKRIEPKEIAKWQKDLLKPEREMWKYKYVNPDSIKLR